MATAEKKSKMNNKIGTFREIIFSENLREGTSYLLYLSLSLIGALTTEIFFSLFVVMW